MRSCHHRPTSPRTLKKLSATWLTALLLAACSDGGSSTTDSAPPSEAGAINDAGGARDASRADTTRPDGRADPDATPPTDSGDDALPTDSAPTADSAPDGTAVNDSAPPGDGPPASGAMPTKTNTGPRFALTDMTPSDFFASKVCHRARITGSLAFDKPSMKGQTYSITDCEVTGAISVYIAGGGAQLALDEMPTITIDHTDVNGGIYLNNAAKLTIDHSYIARGQWSLDDVWAPFVTGPAPFTVSNSVFYGPYMTQPSHTEALHVGDYGTGIRFTNVAFVQQGGPLANSGVTAAINFHGSGAVFDGCWFLWDGPTPAYYTVYIDGPGNVVKNCRFEKGAGDYVYPTSTTMATYISNRDLTSGALISLP